MTTVDEAEVSPTDIPSEIASPSPEPEVTETASPEPTEIAESVPTPEVTDTESGTLVDVATFEAKMDGLYDGMYVLGFGLAVLIFFVAFGAMVGVRR